MLDFCIKYYENQKTVFVEISHVCSLQKIIFATQIDWYCCSNPRQIQFKQFCYAYLSPWQVHCHGDNIQTVFRPGMCSPQIIPGGGSSRRDKTIEG